jgi:hypothetical protein
LVETLFRISVGVSVLLAAFVFWLGYVVGVKSRTQGARLGLAAGIFDVHVEIRVGALPVELREDPGELSAILAVELRREGVMRKRGRRQQEHTARYRGGADNVPNLH